MALKDWKKIEKDTRWDKNHVRVEVFKAHKRYGIYIYDWKYHIVEADKLFKSKSQALKFAKSYMRKH